jgi:methanogenic corrinoid protein MtbC1
MYELAFSQLENPLPLAAEAFRCVERNNRGANWDKRSRGLILDDLTHHITFISSAASMSDEAMLKDYVAWVAALCETLKFTLSSMTRAFECIAKAIEEMGYSETDHKALSLWFRKAIDIMESLREEENPYTNPAISEGSTAHLFLQALLEGKRSYAQSIVRSMEKSGITLPELYDRVFVPSQRELGRLWHMGRISVAQEHFVTAATQVIISSLYEFFFESQESSSFIGAAGIRNKPLLVAACARGELHELGMRMIADSFQSKGWETIFLGANMPERDLLGEIGRQKPDFIMLSATLPTHVAWVKRTIGDIRVLDPALKVLVGGRPFISSPSLWEEVGADATAPDCIRALSTAESLLASA